MSCKVCLPVYAPCPAPPCCPGTSFIATNQGYILNSDGPGNVLNYNPAVGVQGTGTFTSSTGVFTVGGTCNGGNYTINGKLCYLVTITSPTTSVTTISSLITRNSIVLSQQTTVIPINEVSGIFCVPLNTVSSIGNPGNSFAMQFLIQNRASEISLIRIDESTFLHITSSC